MVKKVGPRLRELTPMARGSPDTGSHNLRPAFLTIPVSDPPKLDSARASAESALARIYKIRQKLKLRLKQKLRLITESFSENEANLVHKY